MLELPRLTILRQRRVLQDLRDLLEDTKLTKGLHADVRARLTDAVTAGDGLDEGQALSPLLVDNSTDAVFGAFDAWLAAIGRGMTDKVVAPLPPAAAKKKAAAATIRAKALSGGTGFLMKKMSLQYKAMRELLDKLRDDAECKAAITELGAEYWVEHMNAHLAPYGRAVKTQDNRDLEAVGDAFHEAFRDLAFATFTHHGKNAALRARVLGAYEKELDAQRTEDRDARKRAAKKAAPATG